MGQLNWNVNSQPHATISCLATIAAISLPETLVTYGGKLLFALLTAALTSLVSVLIGNIFRKK